MIINFANDTLLSLPSLKRRLDLLNPPIGSADFPETLILGTESAPAFSVVTSTGKLANSGNLAHFGRVVGLTLAAMASGFNVRVATVGEIRNPAWNWVRGDILLLNGTTLSTTAPASGFVQIIGTASSATAIIIEIGPATLY